MDPFTFDLSDMKTLDLSDIPPLAGGVYALFDEGGKVLYIGESGGIRTRFRQHRRQKKWWKDVTEARYASSQDTDERLTLETVLILRHRPRHNRAVKLGLAADGTVFALNFLRGSKGRAK